MYEYNTPLTATGHEPVVYECVCVCVFSMHGELSAVVQLLFVCFSQWLEVPSELQWALSVSFTHTFSYPAFIRLCILECIYV